MEIDLNNFSDLFPMRFKYDSSYEVEVKSFDNNVFKCFVFYEGTQLPHTEYNKPEISNIIKCLISNLNQTLSRISNA